MNYLPLFVYGTLLQSESQGGLLGALPRRPATVRGQLYHLPAGYPALCLAGDDLVHGELVEAPEERLLGMLDHYEGVHDGLFRRQIATALLGLATERAWVYVMAAPQNHGGRYLPAGRWRSQGWRR